MHKTHLAVHRARYSRQETAPWDFIPGSSLSKCREKKCYCNAIRINERRVGAWERERTTQIESRSTRSLNSVLALFASRNDAGTND